VVWEGLGRFERRVVGAWICDTHISTLECLILEMSLSSRILSEGHKFLVILSIHCPETFVLLQGA
jgi:hypothetical protein